MPTRVRLPLLLSAALLAAIVPESGVAQQRPAITVPSGPGGADPALFRTPQLDPLSLVIAYHRFTGTSIDFRPYAEASAAYRNATAFDRPDVLTREIARLEGVFANLDLRRTYLMRLGTQLRQYDASRGGYALALNPEAFVPMTDPVNYRAFGVQFRNSDDVTFLPVGDVTAARNFAQRHGLSTQFENAGDVVAELVLRLVEAPPAVSGGTTIVRADIVTARILTRQGQPIWDFGSTSAARAPAANVAAPGTIPTLKAADVQGVRVGMPIAEGVGIASRAYPTRRYSDERGARFFRGILPQVEAQAVGMHADTAIRCGLDELTTMEQTAQRPIAETIGGVADTSEACLGFDAGQGNASVPRNQVGRVTSGQRLSGTTVDAVRQALVEKYGQPTYTRDGGREMQWLGRDPARSDGGLVSITARLAQRPGGGVLLGVEATPYVDPNARPAAAPASAPAAPRL